jgi:hypothetical protein
MNSNITRLPFLLTLEEVFEWAEKFTAQWNAEIRVSYDSDKDEYVAEAVYSNSKCKVSRDKVLYRAFHNLLESLGGLGD